MLASAGFAADTSVVGAGTATIASIKDLGFSAAVAGGAMTEGLHRFEVVSLEGANSPAVLKGDPTAANYPIQVGTAPSERNLNLTVNGVARSVSIAAGNYTTVNDMVVELQARLNTAYGAGVVTVGLDGAAITLTTAATGSTASIQVAGGGIRDELGLNNSSPVYGTDNPGVIVALDGKETALGTNLTPGTVRTISAPDGSTMTITVGSTPIRLGSGTVDVVRTTSTQTTLSELATALSAHGGPATAQVVNTGTDVDPYRLVMSAKTTGSDAQLTVNLSGFAGFGAGLSQTQAGQDALMTIGSLQIYRQSNTVNDLIKGVTIDLVKADPTADVTIGVQRDADTIVAKAKGFVDKLNELHAKLQQLTRYDVEKKEAAVLQGDQRVRSVLSKLFDATAETVTDTGNERTLLQLGIRYQADGKYSFDETKLRSALATNFEGVVDLFARTGDAADSRLSLLAATDDTTPGVAPYAVQITQAATKAEATSAALTTLTATSDITVTVGAATLTYFATAGSHPSAIANGLNREFREKGFALTASAEAGRVVVRSTAFGAGASFTIGSTGGQLGLNGTFTGTDVAGTIDGIAATGQGQTLTSATGASTGLSLRITASATDVAGAGGTLSLGTIAYKPGVAGNMSRTIKFLTGEDGPLSAAREGASRQSRDLEEQIKLFEQRLEQRRMRYVRQFTTLETTLGQLQNQSSWLAATMGSLVNAQGAK
jgi:flagellar hook-associated protein 2